LLDKDLSADVKFVFPKEGKAVLGHKVIIASQVSKMGTRIEIYTKIVEYK